MYVEPIEVLWVVITAAILVYQYLNVRDAKLDVVAARLVDDPVALLVSEGAHATQVRRLVGQVLFVGIGLESFFLPPQPKICATSSGWIVVASLFAFQAIFLLNTVTAHNTSKRALAYLAKEKQASEQQKENEARFVRAEDRITVGEVDHEEGQHRADVAEERADVAQADREGLHHHADEHGDARPDEHEVGHNGRLKDRKEGS